LEIRLKEPGEGDKADLARAERLNHSVKLIASWRFEFFTMVEAAGIEPAISTASVMGKAPLLPTIIAKPLPEIQTDILANAAGKRPHR
jgi:hypothetical protein